MKILKIYTQKLRYKRYSNRTILTYTSYLKMFLTEQNIKDPYQVTLQQIVHYLENRHYSSVSQQNQIIGSLKLFARYILDKKHVHLKKIERPRKQYTHQPVIPREFLLQRLSEVKNIKHKLILTLGYACGMRVSEVLNLRWLDINRNQKHILIKSGKGNKDRLVPINDAIIELLTKYYWCYKTRNYVFTGQNQAVKYSATSCNKIVKRTFGIQYRFHSLRKSCSVHLYEMGNDMAKIQDLLGHKNIETTRSYVGKPITALQSLTQLVT